MVSGGLTDEEMSALEAPQSGLSDQEMEAMEAKRLVESSKGSGFKDEVRKQYLPKIDKTEQVLRTVANVGTFGTQPYISAGVKTLADKFGDYFLEKEIDPETGEPIQDQSTYRGNVLNEQLRNEAIDNPYIKGAGTVTKIARDVLAPAKTIAQRVGIPVVTGMAEKAGESDLNTLEGWEDVGAAGLTNLATSAGLEGVSQGIKGVVGFGRESKTFTQPELIERYILSKKNRTPKGVEQVVENKDLLAKYSKEGMQNVGERLGKDIAPFRQALSQKTDDIVQTPEAIAMVERLNPPISRNTPANLSYAPEKVVSSADQYAQALPVEEEIFKQTKGRVGKLPEGQDVFLNNIQTRLQRPKSSSEILQIVDDIDDEAKAFYDKQSIVGGKRVNLKKADKAYYQNLVDIRNSLKDSIRTQDSAHGLADQAFSEFEKNKPLLQDIKDADFKYQKIANPTLRIESEAQSPTVPWSVSGIPASVANFLKKRLYSYKEPLSEELSKNAPDPQKILGLDGDFTQSIDFKPWLSNLGEGSNRLTRGITNSMSRGISDQYGESPNQRFQNIVDKIPNMGPYQQELLQAMEKGKLPILHFYLMKTDPQYQQLFNEE